MIQLSTSHKKKIRKLLPRNEQDLNDCLLSTQRVSLRNQEFQNHLNRSVLIRSKRFIIPEESFLGRRMFYSSPETGYFQNPPDSPSPLAALSNPDHSALTDMMKNQFGFLILNGGMGYLVSTLFSGFYIAYIPLPISYSFKVMLQRGVENNSNVPASFLSALSFYFIVLLACGDIVNLFFWLIGFEFVANTQIDIPMMNHQVSPFGNQVDFSKLFRDESESLQMTPIESALDGLESAIIELLELPTLE
ncbi:putative ER membrane protein complex subunit 3 [Cryptosporidium felis]|nr:putative ER membrane protein complex subunit 3 [Cryptosporidium felis]